LYGGHVDIARDPVQISAGHQIILNATGCFKSVVPYLTLRGLLYRLNVVYIFEQSNALLTLPPAPIHFDLLWARI
jgi:CRISPR/Cas system-associated protein Csm6